MEPWGRVIPTQVGLFGSLEGGVGEQLADGHDRSREGLQPQCTSQDWQGRGRWRWGVCGM